MAGVHRERARAALQIFGPAVDVSGRCVLDVGCGLGSRTLGYVELGARWVVGLDISPERTRLAAATARGWAAGARPCLVVADAGRLPFRAERFDCVLSTDAWEHLDVPLLALRECARVLRPGGTLAISALPYYSPWGAHAWSWLPLPWIQVILPRRRVFGLMAWIEAWRHVNAHRPSAVRMDWRRPDDPAHVRRLTVAALERCLALSGLAPLRCATIPVGAAYGGMLARLTGRLVRLPLLREVLAGIVVIVARK